jgi:hypothetical protein
MSYPRPEKTPVDSPAQIDPKHCPLLPTSQGKIIHHMLERDHEEPSISFKPHDYKY